jgi:hypothetical protein
MGQPYINNPTQTPYGICAVHHITPHSGSILHNTARHHNHILRRLCQLLDHQVHHLPEGGILILEQLGDAKKEGCGLVGGEFLAREEEERNLGE